MVRTRSVERSRWHVYWKRATELRDAMHISKDRALWNAVALLSVHCLISAADSVLVYRQKIRSAGEQHQEVAELLGRDRELPDLNRALNHLRKGLAKKNLAAYEDRDLSTTEVGELADHADRFYDWASGLLPQS